MSIVWLAGSISGAVLQPYFGVLSDRCMSSWGRRRLFIVGGTIIAIISLIGLAYAVELANISITLLSLNSSECAVLSITISCICALNIAIQPIQGGLRTLIVDSCPSRQQSVANAWAGRIVSAANLLSYFVSSLDLPDLLPYFRQTQFEMLCIITCLFLAATVCLTCIVVKESPLGYQQPRTKYSPIGANIEDWIKAFSKLPTRIRRTMEIQFFSWMGWFQFLYYITT